MPHAYKEHYLGVASFLHRAGYPDTTVNKMIGQMMLHMTERDYQHLRETYWNDN